MSSDTVLKDKAGKAYSYDNLRTSGYLRGQPAGLDAATGFLEERAIELFRGGKHEAAIDMQNLAKEMRAKLRPMLEKRADDHERHYSIEIKVGPDGWTPLNEDGDL
jgi:hypothetical protein